MMMFFNLRGSLLKHGSLFISGFIIPYSLSHYFHFHEVND